MEENFQRSSLNKIEMILRLKLVSRKKDTCLLSENYHFIQDFT